jgi:hypothetical protein
VVIVSLREAEHRERERETERERGRQRWERDKNTYWQHHINGNIRCACKVTLMLCLFHFCTIFLSL